MEETAVPIIQETDADNTPTELEGLQPHDDKTKGAFEVIQEEDAHELFPMMNVLEEWLQGRTGTIFRKWLLWVS